MHEDLRGVVERWVSAASAHVIDLVVSGDHDRQVIEVYIDAEGPVTTEMCAEISRQISAEAEGRELVPSRYRLDVSSPGIDRPLRFPWQYKKHIGRTLRVVLRETPTMQPQTGKLVAVDEEGLLLVFKGSEESHRIAWSTVLEATVAPPW